MMAYLDSSVILSHLLRQKNALKPWGQWDEVCLSQICRLEAFRAFQRLRLINQIDDDEMAILVQDFRKMFEQADIIELDDEVLDGAEKPFATSVGSLDAIHLASALLWESERSERLTFLTHDIQLGRAALAAGLDAKGFR